MKEAVSDVAETIKSYLHFSVPDEEPLTDYEDWMPDFMQGLADGIEKSRSLIRGAVSDVAGDMVISPQMASMQGNGDPAAVLRRWILPCPGLSICQ